jgi:hypothetical protein
LKRSPLPRKICVAAVTAALLLFTISCAVPLAPGYQILKQTFEVQFVPGTTPELRIHNVYTLQNSGTTPLTFIDVVFPDAKTYGRTNLQVQLDGRVTTPQNLPEEYEVGSPGALRLPLASPWAQKEKRELVVDYTLAPAARADAQAAEGFHLGTRGWLPVFLPPNHILASAPTRPPTTSYTVKVPGTFVIVARGSAAGRKQDGSDTIYQFKLGQDDLAPYIVAGRYLSSSPPKNSGDAVFWTTQPLPANAAATPQRFATAWSVLQKNFGQLNKRASAPFIVESPAISFETADPASGNFRSFPGGVFVTPAALVSSTGSMDPIERSERALARTWFGDALYPAPTATVVVGEGLPGYATIVIDDSIDGPSARRSDVVALLQVYDDARGQLKVTEKSVAATLPAASLEQRRIAYAKAPLLFIALEDSCGGASVRQGIADSIQLLRGKEVSINDLRAAIEYTCGKSLAEPFRAWLYNPGIPPEFRAHYGPAEENKN